MKSPHKVLAKIYRFDPSKDEKARYETYEVPYEKDMRVLDVLNYIVDNLQPGIANRWFCGVKKCGACAVMVNGSAVLACWEAASTMMVIEPLRNFPIIRDLVVDCTGFNERMIDLRPLVERDQPYPGFPEPLTHVEIEPAYKVMSCIECMCCMAACDVLAEEKFEKAGKDWGGFYGPAAMVQLAEVALHPRDSADRVSLALKGGLEYCLSCNSCTLACPNEIPILTGAIDKLRDKAIASKAYWVRGWWLVKRLPPWMRSILRCKLKLTLGEAVKSR